MAEPDTDTQPAEARQFELDVLNLRPALRGFAHRLAQNPYDRDDLVQETLYKAFRYQNHYQPGTKLKSWLFTIMRNHFNTEYTLRRREPVSLSDDPAIWPISLPSQDWTLYEHDAQKLIQALPSQQRAALMHVSAGTSYEEAAASLGCEIGTIKSRVGRARQALMARMGDVFTSRETYFR